jgi:hypothetical protein
MKIIKTFKLKGNDLFHYLDKFAVGEESTALVKTRIRFETPY